MRLQTSAANNLTQNRKGISGSTLKLVAVFSMLVDHTAASILQNPAISANHATLLSITPWMRAFGRLAFPIFCFLLIEGFLHTKSVKKYAFRLALFALISEIPFDLAFSYKPFDFSYQNVFFTLLIGLLVLEGFRRLTQFKDRKWLILPALLGIAAAGYILSNYLVLGFVNVVNYTLYYLGESSFLFLSLKTDILLILICVLLSVAIYLFIRKKRSAEQANLLFARITVMTVGMALASILSTDYFEFGILTIAAMYALRKSRVAEMAAGSIILTLSIFNEFPSILDIPLIYWYNGNRGLRLKYFFYIFYPAHLLLLYLIGYIIQIAG